MNCKRIIMETYDVDFFIKKFEAIPSWKWTTGTFTRKRLMGLITQHCTLGHMDAPDKFTRVPEIDALYNLTIRYCGVTPMDINDGITNTNQRTPKKRILAALYDIKAMQQAEIKKREELEVAEKKKIVYVTVDERVRELQEQELTLN